LKKFGLLLNAMKFEQSVKKSFESTGFFAQIFLDEKKEF